MVSLRKSSELILDVISSQSSFSHDRHQWRRTDQNGYDNDIIPVERKTAEVSSEDDDSYDELSMYEDTAHVETILATPADKLTPFSKDFHFGNRIAAGNTVVNMPVGTLGNGNKTVRKKKFRKVRCSSLKIKPSMQDKLDAYEIEKATIVHNQETGISDEDIILTDRFNPPDKIQNSDIFDSTASDPEQRYRQLEGNAQKNNSSIQALKQKRPGSGCSKIKTSDDKRSKCDNTHVYGPSLESRENKGCKIVSSSIYLKTSIDQSIVSEGSKTDSFGENETLEDNIRTTYRKSDKKQQINSAFYQCSLCPKTFSNKYQLREHKTIHTGETPHACDVCGKAFRQWRGVTKHKLFVHSAEKKFDCSVCLKAFKTADSLKKHMEIHTRSRCKCDTCGRDFSRLQTLKNHIVYKHANVSMDTPINLECVVCHKTFSTHSTLKLHFQVHEGNQQFECDFCGSFFSRKIDRDRHRMRHTGEKPYKCNQCDYSCIQPGDFNRHKLKHADQNGGKKRHTCPYCNKTLVRKIEMTEHLLTHSPNMNYNIFQCKECGEYCKSRYSLRKHQIESHKKKILCGGCGKAFTSVTNKNRHKTACKFTSKSPRSKANFITLTSSCSE